MSLNRPKWAVTEEQWAMYKEEMGHGEPKMKQEVIEDNVGDMVPPFTHLHLHTDASLKDGLGAVDRLVDRAKEMGYGALGLTDHGTLANAIDFTIKCEKAGIKPIMGVEAYIKYNDMANQQRIGHITLLANGDAGWKSLVALQNNAYDDMNRGRPLITKEMLFEYNDNIIVLSGCAASPMNNLPPTMAAEWVESFVRVFGKRFFLEFMPLDVLEGQSYKTALAMKSTYPQIPLVLTNDVHFALEDDAKVHSILTQMKANFEYDSTDNWMKDWQSIVHLGHKLSISGHQLIEGMTNAAKIANIIQPVKLKRKQRLPEIEDADDKLQELVQDRLNKWLGDDEEILFQQWYDRIDYELGIIISMEFSEYFLILDDIIQYAHRNEIKVGPCRGSGGGSLVLYVLGITQINPLKFNLSFERFINPERKGLPDVDVDFCAHRRYEVLSYVEETYGAVPIAVYSRYKHRVLVHDLFKELRMDKKLETQVKDEFDAEGPYFQQAVKEEPTFGHAYSVMINQIRHRGKHAGGMIIAPPDIPIPIEKAGDHKVAAWIEGMLANHLSYAGIVKFDLLGLTALTILDKLEMMTGVKPPLFPEDGAPEFALFREGNVSGIFQFTGSDGIREMTMAANPDSFLELVAMAALYRPGALDAGTAQNFVEWKHNPRKIHPLIDDVLEETYGIIVYQEQLMEIYRRCVGGNLADADEVRRLFSKRKSEESQEEWEGRLEVTRIKYMDIASNNVGEQVAEMLWTEFRAHARYSFNKSHAVGYTAITAQMAYFKFHHPVEFFAVCMSVDSQNSQQYAMDAVKMGIEILSPHVNVSTFDYVPVLSGSIRMPLNAIKGLAIKGSTAIMAERTEGGDFTSYDDFVNRVAGRAANKRVKGILLNRGGFDGLEIPDEQVDKIPDIDAYGFTVPTKRMLDTIKEQEAEGLKCGVVMAKKNKMGEYGAYTSYRLSPYGTFWTKEQTSLKVGNFVAVKTNDYGKVIDGYLLEN